MLSRSDLAPTLKQLLRKCAVLTGLCHWNLLFDYWYLRYEPSVPKGMPMPQFYDNNVDCYLIIATSRLLHPSARYSVFLEYAPAFFAYFRVSFVAPKCLACFLGCLGYVYQRL